MDTRLQSLQAWLASELRGEPFSLAPASEDASFRRYFRATLATGATYVVMDAPPDKEDCGKFARIAGMLRHAGVSAPELHAADYARGFLLLSDLGRETYLQVLLSGQAGEAEIEGLYADALDALIKWQLASTAGALPPYDDALLRRELGLFPDWYVSRHLGRTLADSQRSTLERINALLVDSALAQPSVYVHRDYMPRNLMRCEPNPGVLDFQDAVLGPITYDLASLMRDAFISWEEPRVLDWCIRYWEKARRAHLPVRGDFSEFYRELEWMGLQRHMKVLGIFARIRYRDGKPRYLEDAPRFLAYARAVAGRYPALAPLLKLLDELHDRYDAEPPAGGDSR